MVQLNAELPFSAQHIVFETLTEGNTGEKREKEGDRVNEIHFGNS